MTKQQALKEINSIGDGEHLLCFVVSYDNIKSYINHVLECEVEVDQSECREIVENLEAFIQNTELFDLWDFMPKTLCDKLEDF